MLSTNSHRDKKISSKQSNPLFSITSLPWSTPNPAPEKGKEKKKRKRNTLPGAGCSLDHQHLQASIVLPLQKKASPKQKAELGGLEAIPPWVWSQKAARDTEFHTAQYGETETAFSPCSIWQIPGLKYDKAPEKKSLISIWFCTG